MSSLPTLTVLLLGYHHLRLQLLALLLLDLEQQCAIDVREYTTEGDGRTDECVKLFVTPDRELQVAWCDALDLEILGCVAGEFEDFGGKVFENCGDVDGGFRSDAHLVLGLRLEETLDTSAGKLMSHESVLLDQR